MTWRKEADKLGRMIVFYEGEEEAHELASLDGPEGDHYLQQIIYERLIGEYKGHGTRLLEAIDYGYADDYEPVEAVRKSLKKAIRTARKALKL